MTTESSSNSVKNPPHPHLSREETNERMKQLGFHFHPDGTLATNMFHGEVGNAIALTPLDALEELLGGAIADWNGLDGNDAAEGMEAPFTDEEAWGRLADELQEWAEEYLVG